MKEDKLDLYKEDKFEYLAASYRNEVPLDLEISRDGHVEKYDYCFVVIVWNKTDEGDVRLRLDWYGHDKTVETAVNRDTVATDDGHVLTTRMPDGSVHKLVMDTGVWSDYM